MRKGSAVPPLTGICALYLLLSFVLTDASTPAQFGTRWINDGGIEKADQLTYLKQLLCTAFMLFDCFCRLSFVLIRWLEWRAENEFSLQNVRTSCQDPTVVTSEGMDRIGWSLEPRGLEVSQEQHFKRNLRGIQ